MLLLPNDESQVFHSSSGSYEPPATLRRLELHRITTSQRRNDMFGWPRPCMGNTGHYWFGHTVSAELATHQWRLASISR
jgi:hypothetical protein